MNDELPEGAVLIDMGEVVAHAMERERGCLAAMRMLAALCIREGGELRFTVKELEALEGSGLGVSSEREGEEQVVRLNPCDDPTHNHRAQA